MDQCQISPKKFRESLNASRNLDSGECLPRGQIQLGVQSSITAQIVLVQLHIKKLGTVAVLQVRKALMLNFISCIPLEMQTGLTTGVWESLWVKNIHALFIRNIHQPTNSFLWGVQELTLCFPVFWTDKILLLVYTAK